MRLARQIAKCPPDFILAGTARHPQTRVVIVLRPQACERVLGSGGGGRLASA
eukprot:ctg_6002.g540